MNFVTLPAGERVPAFGMGTWYVGEDPASRAEEIATLRLGLDLGAHLIDTAEMYGEGLAEQLVGEAIAGRRDEVFLVSKVYPHNATRSGTTKACDRSLRRLRTDRIDLYLLHWRDAVPLAETLDAFMALQQAGKIRHYGVSNLDVADMEELWTLPGGRDVQTDQVLYNLARRGIEWDLLPRLREHGVPVMAYSPIERKALADEPRLIAFGRRYHMTPAQLAIAWLLRHDDIIVIPKTSHRQHLREDIQALDMRLTPEQLAELDSMFPPPDGPRPLEMH